MLLTTERLRIVPLTPRQLGLWLYDIPALGKELDCRYTAGSPHGDFRRIVEGQHALAAADPGNHLFHTFWFLILRDGGAVAGSACFKGAADADGRVEIGYGLEKAFEKQGYMTEAVRALCAWAKQQPGVRSSPPRPTRITAPRSAFCKGPGFHPAEADATRWWSL